MGVFLLKRVRLQILYFMGFGGRRHPISQQQKKQTQKEDNTLTVWEQ